MTEKHLIKRSNCWHLNYRLPVRWSGKMVRTSLKTSDVKQARLIRDRFINPIILQDGAINALEEIAKYIQTNDKLITKHISQVKNIIFDTGQTSLKSALDKYFEYLSKSSLRPSSKKDYTAALRTITTNLDITNSVNSLQKEDAIKTRDSMMDTLSATRIVFCFQTFRAFLRWCATEGLAKAHIDDEFIISLPSPDKEHTHDIPPPLADPAMLLLPDWTLAPRISRFTGMRLNEVLMLTPEKIILEHGIYCFALGTETKTKSPRVIPIAEKLKPYVIDKDLKELQSLGHKNDKYNRRIKDIKGLEKCSFHSWRVYFNTRLMQLGIDKAIRMALLGHKASSDDVHTGYTSVKLADLKLAVDLV